MIDMKCNVAQWWDPESIIVSFFMIMTPMMSSELQEELLPLLPRLLVRMMMMTVMTMPSFRYVDVCHRGHHGLRLLLCPDDHHGHHGHHVRRLLLVSAWCHDSSCRGSLVLF